MTTMAAGLDRSREVCMTEQGEGWGEKLKLVERARENTYFRRLDEEILAGMRRRAAAEEQAEEGRRRAFSPVLVPVDLSAHSLSALHHAADLAGRLGSRLVVLHVIPREVSHLAIRRRLGLPEATGVAEALGRDVSSEAVEEVLRDHREEAYADLQAFLPPRLAELDVELRVVVGAPLERIVETAVQEDAALIVLGTHGRTGLSRAVMGSVAERVVRFAPCPVLAVKAGTPDERGWLARVHAELGAAG